MTSAEPFFFTGADGLRLAGERWDGGGRGAPVVLLHGGGQTRHSWSRTAARLAVDGRTAIALDARGHGDSAWSPEGRYVLDAYAGDLVAFIDTLDEPPVLIGASLGGITSLYAVGENPGLASRLVLVDIVVKVEPAGVARIIEFMSAHAEAGFASLDAVADAIAAYNPHRKRPRNLEGVKKNVRLHDDGRWYWHWDPSFVRIDDEAQRRFDRALLRQAAAAVTIPTLLVRGGQSDVVSDDGMADMLTLIPHAVVADVSAAGHMVAGDDNDVFGDALETFLG